MKAAVYHGPGDIRIDSVTDPDEARGGDLVIEWRERDDHVLMTGTATFEYEGNFDPALFAQVG